MVPSDPNPRRNSRNRLRLAASAALGIGVAALMMSGCVRLTGVSPVQKGSIGDIDLVIKGCGEKVGGPIACQPGPGDLESNATGMGQVLLGLSIDARHVPPATFTTDAPFGSQPFTMSASYTAELTRLDPPGPGRKWVGYISDARTYNPGQEVSARMSFARPPLPDGSPAGDRFVVSPRLGSRAVESPDLLATRPVTCGDSLTVVSPDLTICSDAGGSGTAILEGLNDFAFLTPAPVSVQAGQTAVVPIVGKLAGPARLAINFALSATTTVPGAAALTNGATLAPLANSTTTVAVSVPVPPGTAPGTYAVTLTGTLATGETRAATGTVIVAAPGSAGGVTGRPALSGLTISRTSISNARGSAPAVISVSVASPGRLTVLLERRVLGRKKNGRCVAPTAALRRSGARICSRFVVVSSSTRAAAAGVTAVSISGRSGGRKRPAGTYRVTLTHVDAAGAAGAPLSTTFTIRP